MKFLQGPRANLGRYFLGRNAKKVRRDRTYNNLDTAVTVGVIFDADRNADIEVVKQFVDSLIKDGKRVDVLGMVQLKEQVTLHNAGVGFSYFATEDCNFLCYPRSVAALQFITQKYDILFNICPQNNLCTDYIVGMSKARFKVSTQLGDQAYADFILQFSTPAKGVGQIIGAIRQYLSNIAKAQA